MEKFKLNYFLVELQENEASIINGGGSGFEWLGKVVGCLVETIDSIRIGTSEGGYAKCKIG